MANIGQHLPAMHITPIIKMIVNVIARRILAVVGKTSGFNEIISAKVHNAVITKY